MKYLLVIICILLLASCGDMEIHEAGEGAGIDNTSTKSSLYDEIVPVTPDGEEFADAVLPDGKTNDEASHEEDNHISIARFSGLSYLGKIWVVDNWAGRAYTYPLSFFITSIENGVIELCPHLMSLPQLDILQ